MRPNGSPPPRPIWLPSVAALALFLVGCGLGTGNNDRSDDSADDTPLPECAPRSPETANPEARALIETAKEYEIAAGSLIEDAVLRSVSIFWTDGQPMQFDFIYTDGASSEASVIHVFENPSGEIEAIPAPPRATPDYPEEPLPVGNLTTGPSTVSEAVAVHVPGIEVGAISIHHVDCRLEWHVSGFLRDRSGAPNEVIEATVIDASGQIEVTDRRPAR